MASVNPVRVRIPQSLAVLRKSAPQEYLFYIRRALQSVAPLGQDIAEQSTPVGATERLVDSIQTIIPASIGIRYEWKAPYAAAVNEGQRPHWVPIEALKRWVLAVKKEDDPDVPYKIRSKIRRKGVRPQRFLEKARAAILKQVIPELRERLALVARLLGGR